MSGQKITCLDCGQVNRIAQDKPASAAKCGTCGAKLMDGKVHEVDLATLQKAARNDDVPLVVDFWAPWCGPCKMMAPEFSKAAASHAGQVRFVKLNTEAEPAAGQRYNIRGIPTMAAFKGGSEKARQSGAMPAAQISAWVTQSI